MSLLDDDPSFPLWNLDSNDLLFADGTPRLVPETPRADFEINMDVEQWIINDLDRVNENVGLIYNDQSSCAFGEFVDVATDLKESPDSFAGDFWTQSSWCLPEAAASLLPSTDCAITDEIQPASTNEPSVTATDWNSSSCLDFRDAFDLPEKAQGGPPDSCHGNEASSDCVIAGRGHVESDSSLPQFLESPSRVPLPRDASRPEARGSFRNRRKDHRKPRNSTRGVRSLEREARDILPYVTKDALLYRKIPTNTRRKVKGPQVWQFLLRLLASPSSNSLVHWEDRAKKTFVLTEPDLVARLWGFRNSKENFTYEKLSRAMRYHYHKGNLEAVLDHKFMYRFGSNVDIDLIM